MLYGVSTPHTGIVSRQFQLHSLTLPDLTVFVGDSGRAAAGSRDSVRKRTVRERRSPRDMVRDCARSSRAEPAATGETPSAKRRSWQAKRLAKLIIGDLTCGAHSHIIPGPIYGFTFQTKQNHECTQITQRHVARTCR